MKILGLKNFALYDTTLYTISTQKPRLHEHQVPNPDSNLDHNPHGRGGLSPDLNPVCLRINATNLDQDLDRECPCKRG